MTGSGIIRLALLAGMIGLAACEPANNDNAAGGSSRVRLSANSADATIGDYAIHVNAMLTSDLTADVAQAYGIQRSENQGFVNLVVLKKSADAKHTGRRAGKRPEPVKRQRRILSGFALFNS